MSNNTGNTVHRNISYTYPVLGKNSISMSEILSNKDYVVCRKGRKSVIVELETSDLNYAREYCEKKGNYGCYIVYMNQALETENRKRQEYTTLPLYYNGASFPRAELSVGEGVELRTERGKVIVFHETTSNKLNTIRLI